MYSINAISLTDNVYHWLVDSHSPRLLHVFDYVCNLINERGEILSVVTPEIGNGPFNLVVEEDILFSRLLSLKSPISLSHTQLHLGDLAIMKADAKRWNPHPNWERLHMKKDRILSQLMSMRAPLRAEHSPLELLIALSLANADISNAKTLTSHLAGLGQGLTPSGDDFLMGAIYAIWILYPPEIANALAKEITNVAAPLTTSLSAAWLRSTGRGEAGVLWHEFFNALLTGENLELPVAKLLSIGETSGADALAGFFGVITAYKERIIDQCPS